MSGRRKWSQLRPAMWPEQRAASPEETARMLAELVERARAYVPILLDEGEAEYVFVAYQTVKQFAPDGPAKERTLAALRGALARGNYDFTAEVPA
jgi:hypothetical protein